MSAHSPEGPAKRDPAQGEGTQPPPLRSNRDGYALGDPGPLDNSTAAWSWRDLWRRGGSAAVVVVAATCWLLIALWFVSNGAPSAGGEPPDLVVIEPEPTMAPLSDEMAPTAASGAGAQ